MTNPVPPAEYLHPPPPGLSSEMEDWQPPVKQGKGEPSLSVVALFPPLLGMRWMNLPLAFYTP